MKIKYLVFVLLSLFFSTSFATQLFTCTKFSMWHEVLPQLQKLEPTFQTNKNNCKVVVTRSIFPQAKNGTVNFEPGLQLFIYENTSLRFICIPGWICQHWQ